jgi:hypothetical protein
MVDLNTYIGQTVTINNLVKNCKWGDHKCYVYLDACNLLLSKNEVNEKNIIDFYPNPFSLETVLRTNHLFHLATLTVYNSFGQIVNQIKNISGKAVTLRRDNLPSGLYFFQLTEGGKTFATGKLMIADK